MSIKRLPVRGPDGTVSIRDHQVRMTEVGRIRTGRFDPEKGRSGAPTKLDTFRFTAANEQLIRSVADVYGGTPAQFTPQRQQGQQWEVVVPLDEVEVFVPRQRIEPWLEAWRPGTCIRRCDGERETIKDEPCLCAAGQVAENDLCKPVVRVQVMLADVPVIGTWRLESHGRYAVGELATLGPLFEQVQMPIPALMRLRKEDRRTWNAEKGKYDSLTFYVPHLIVAVATPRQMIDGTAGEAMELEAAKQASAIPALSVGGPEPAPATTDAEPARPGPTSQPTSEPTITVLDDDAREVILRKIEEAQDQQRLDEIFDKLVARKVKDEKIKQALQSKAADIQAAVETAQRRHQAALKEAALKAQAKPSGDPYDSMKGGVSDAEEWSQISAPVAATKTRYDQSIEFMGLVADVGPSWTTAQVHDAIHQHAGVERTQEATGAQIHALRQAIKEGWRPLKPGEAEAP